jgi:hypothetical protein
MALQYRGVRTSFLFVNFDKVAALKAARSRVNAVRYSTMWFQHVMIRYGTVQYSTALPSSGQLPLGSTQRRTGLPTHCTTNKTAAPMRITVPHVNCNSVSYTSNLHTDLPCCHCCILPLYACAVPACSVPTAFPLFQTLWYGITPPPCVCRLALLLTQVKAALHCPAACSWPSGPPLQPAC